MDEDTITLSNISVLVPSGWKLNARRCVTHLTYSDLNQPFERPDTCPGSTACSGKGPSSLLRCRLGGQTRVCENVKYQAALLNEGCKAWQPSVR